MTTIQLLATISAAAFTVYVIAGVATYMAVPAALRREPPTVVLILGWPLIWIASDIAHNITEAVEETDGLQLRDENPNKWRDETRDDRAQLVTPRWMPMLLVGLAVVATVLNEVFGPLGEMQSVYAVDTPPQLALLTVAVTVLALIKLVGWYRRRGSRDV